ncbi:MAG: class I SAM-dependent methyltransferase [Rhodospirillaceae bacterium]|nr:class I SAM-dependent methyltransferase [Rhodospirillaceae bacterium]
MIPQAVDARIAEHGRRWREKPALREIYLDLYRRMAAELAAGTTLEIGGGAGIFKEYAPDVVTTDILAAPWLDLVADAQFLPVGPATFDNIVMFDVLHHIEFPRRFLYEASRVLRPGGRIIMVEPAITPLSWPFYRWLHPEPVDLSADPLHEGRPEFSRDAFDANQAIPTRLMARDRRRFLAAFPEFIIRRRSWLSLLAYPLSGGFQPWCLIPRRCVAPVLWIENILAPIVGRLFGFRLLIVIEKRAAAG